MNPTDLPPTDRPASDLPTGRIATAEIKGADVYDTEGRHIAIIHDVVLDSNTGKAVSAILAIGSILGMGGEHHEVPWTSLAYDQRQNGFVLGIPLSQMESAPDEDEEEDGWPAAPAVPS